MKGKSASRNLNQRERLRLMFLEAPYCFWCARKVYHYPHQDGAQIPDDAATNDHFFQKHDPRRHENIYHEKGYGDKKVIPDVLACRECNQLRGEWGREYFGGSYNKKEIFKMEVKNK